MFRKKSDTALAFSLVFAIFLWGGNNTGTKFIVANWGPIWTGSTRFLGAGLLMLAILRWTTWFGPQRALTASLKRQIWLRGGLSLAVYIVVFNWALRLTAASHVALYLGASPVWALLWEGPPEKSWRSAQRYGAALLALAGVFVLFLPALKSAHGHWLGEALGLAGSFLWTLYGRQCRVLGASLSGQEIAAHAMTQAGVILLPLGLIELFRFGMAWRTDLVLVQLYCVVAGGVAAYSIWNHALRRWPTSQVLLFNNLIPLSTMSWARVCLGEPVTPTFWIAMILIVAGVVLGQANWQKLLPAASVPPE